MATYHGLRIAWGGFDESKPITGLPEGRRRLRQRPNCYTRIYVRTEGSIQEFVLEDKGDSYAAIPMRANRLIQTPNS